MMSFYNEEPRLRCIFEPKVSSSDEYLVMGAIGILTNKLQNLLKSYFNNPKLSKTIAIRDRIL